MLRVAKLVGLLAAFAFCGKAASQPIVKLDLHENDPNVISRSYGKFNYLEKYTWLGNIFAPNPSSAPNIKMPYGDRVGYDTCVVGDVDGDGFQDWVETWYHAEPVSAVSGAVRIPSNATILATELPPDIESCAAIPTPLTSVSSVIASNSERVGFCRVISGRDSTLIGTEIWGNSDNARMSHEIARIKDLDGDGRGEIVFATNTSDAERGSVNIYAFSSKYNKSASDTIERWVCILRIVGAQSSWDCTPGLIDGNDAVSEFGYELEDNLPDLNGDGQADILTSTVWWRASANRDSATTFTQVGGSWAFLMPKQSVFMSVQASAAWPASAVNVSVKAPIVMSENDYSLRVINPAISQDPAVRVLPVSDLIAAADVDGDNVMDVVAHSGFNNNSPFERKRGYYFFLSRDGLKDYGSAPTHLLGLPARFGGLNGTGTQAVYVAPTQGAPYPVFSQTQIDLRPADADFVIHGRDIMSANSTLPYDFHYNDQNVFGMQLDNYTHPGFAGFPANTIGDSDIAFFVHVGSGLNGRVYVMLNMQSRFASGGALASCITVANGGTLTPPASFSWDTLPGGYQYSVLSEYQQCPPGSNCLFVDAVNPASTGWVRGVGISGNTDGSGFRDCELAIGVASRHYNEFFPTNVTTPILNIGSCYIIDIPDTIDGQIPQNTPPEVLFRVFGEQYVYRFDNGNPQQPVERVNPNWPRYDTNFVDNLTNIVGTTADLQGLTVDPGWDQDRDGNDDLVLRNTFFPALVTHAYPANPVPTPIVPYAASGTTQPYFVDGGANYIVLSPPATPDVWDTQVEADLGETVVTIVATGLSPATPPFDTFNESDVLLSEVCEEPSFAHALSIECIYIAPSGGSAGHRKIKLRFDSSDYPPGKARAIRFPTRWNAAQGGFCVYIP